MISYQVFVGTSNAWPFSSKSLTSPSFPPISSDPYSALPPMNLPRKCTESQYTQDRVRTEALKLSALKLSYPWLPPKTWETATSRVEGVQNKIKDIGEGAVVCAFTTAYVEATGGLDGATEKGLRTALFRDVLSESVLEIVLKSIQRNGHKIEMHPTDSFRSVFYQWAGAMWQGGALDTDDEFDGYGTEEEEDPVDDAQRGGRSAQQLPVPASVAVPQSQPITMKIPNLTHLNFSNHRSSFAGKTLPGQTVPWMVPSAPKHAHQFFVIKQETMEEDTGSSDNETVIKQEEPDDWFLLAAAKTHDSSLPKSPASRIPKRPRLGRSRLPPRFPCLSSPVQAVNR
ncbi:hypothetical protein FB45DRAFT_1028500 [Roridomyces roridus]|uniref:Uncharacterized protein n=1 Tax=Roridomyces roridus TaxID=1738132 RepID=A0AAD7BQY2_9AGAR|nr:hypothetical protein FB45DRAFT_1028500 [Roridomyces roridus]